MNQQDIVKTLKSILCWVPSNSVGYDKLKELIIQLGGRV